MGTQRKTKRVCLFSDFSCKNPKKKHARLFFFVPPLVFLCFFFMRRWVFFGFFCWVFPWFFFGFSFGFS
jgi:hypothetical protein